MGSSAEWTIFHCGNPAKSPIFDGPEGPIRRSYSTRLHLPVLAALALLSTPTLADDLGLSRRSLYNRFAASGITPAAFIRRVRLEQAKREIESDLSGKVSLTTIALRNGFSDNSSLSHGIKDIYGVTPRELRKARTTEGR